MVQIFEKIKIADFIQYSFKSSKVVQKSNNNDYCQKICFIITKKSLNHVFI